MRVIVCGGRAYDDWEVVRDRLDALHTKTPITTLVHGGAPGADCLGALWAMKRRIPVVEFKADWALHGRAAGPIRNQAMLEAGADLVVAFPGGKGTYDMVKRSRRAGVAVEEIP